MVVGGTQAQCYGANVRLQCTLTGNILRWKKQDGDINLMRGEDISSSTGLYQWELIELEENQLQSTLRFTFRSNISINCSGFESEPASIYLFIDGNVLLK